MTSIPPPVMPGPAVERTPRDAWLMLVVLILFYLLNAFDRTVLSLMVSYVKTDLQVTDAQVGLLLGIAFALLYGLAGVPFGALVDRFARRLVLFAGVVFWSLATVACAFAGSFGQLLGARMLLGIGEAALMPAAHSMLADKFPARRRSTALSIFYLGGVFGNSASVAIGGLAVAHYGRSPWIDLPLLPAIRGWQMPFLIVGALGVAMALLAFVFREPPRRHGPAADSGPRRTMIDILRSRRAVLLSILGSFVLYSTILYGVILWTPTYMSRAFGWTPAQIGPAYAIVHIAGAGLGTVLSGVVVDRLFARGRKDAHLRVLATMLCIAFPIGLLAFSVADPYLFLGLELLLFFFGFSYSGYAASTVQAVAAPDARGRMAAIYLLLLVIVGNGLGPWTIGLLTTHLFQDEARVGASILLMMAVVTPVAILSALAGMRPMRAAVAEVEAIPEPA